MGVDVRICTYTELERRSNQLTHVLADHGVARGSKVVWCRQNSVGVIEGINAAREIPRSMTWMDDLPKTGSVNVLARDLRTPF